MSIYDHYFRRPIFYDYTISGLIAMTIMVSARKGYISIPSSELLYSIVSDIATVSLTLAGFLLTLVTVLISFKSSNKVNKDEIQESDTVFDIFFASVLYFETIKHLNSGIKSLVFIAIIGYLLKICVPKESASYILSFNIGALAIVVFTLARGITILNQIVNMQKQS